MSILITYTCLTQIQAKRTSKTVHAKRRGLAGSTWLTLSLRVKLTTTAAVVVAFPVGTVLVAAHIATALVADTVAVIEMDTATAAHLLDRSLAVDTRLDKADMVVVVGNRAAVVAGLPCLLHRRCPGQVTWLEVAGPENPVSQKLRLRSKTRSMSG